METLTALFLTNGFLISFRVILLVGLVTVIVSICKTLLESYVTFEDERNNNTWLGFSIRIVLGAGLMLLLLWTFQASAYLPKTRVVSETSYEAAKAEEERVAEKLEQGVAESEADVKSKERKSDINIREKFEQLPDK
jgi:preprotein translocase subunit SecF